ncbi:MAG: polysaccharide deacetylase family protein [Lapillicoccus sp.]
MTGPDRGMSRRAMLSGVAGAAILSEAACTGPAGSPGGASSSSLASSTSNQAASRTASAPAGSGSQAPASTSDSSDGVALADPGPDISSGPADRPFVALTFHGAGDPALTAQVLALASAASAGITVFAVGQWLDAHPELGRAIVAAGHDLGNHTWSHQEMPRLTLAQATDEVRRGADAVTRAIGSAGLLFRPSGTPTSTPAIRAAAATAGYQRCVSYDVDPADYTDPGAEAVRSRTLASVMPGSIVSLHLGHPGTVAALPGILAGLAVKGLTPVPVSRLLTPT